MNVNFEIAALFPSPFSRVKKGGNFKTNWTLSSRSYIILALRMASLYIFDIQGSPLNFTESHNKTHLA